jgi:AGZA family xanthine/uracil permease-like MFS transporter
MDKTFIYEDLAVSSFVKESKKQVETSPKTRPLSFLLTTFLAPIVAIIPYEAATPALIIVGFLMMSQIKNIDWDDLGIGVPAFLTIILMPFTYNISVGIGAGFITHVVIRLVQGRGKEIHPLLYLVSGLFMVYFMSSPLNAWLG